MQKFKYIDSLRGVAVLLVVIIHTSFFVKPALLHPYLIPVLNQGARGVQLFYILSAFTLFNSHYKRADEPVKNFFIRRFFRIAPMFYLATAFYLWQSPANFTAANILSNLTFINSFIPDWINSIVPGGWSVAVEAMFYLTLPVLFRYIKNTSHASNFLLLALAIRMIGQCVFSGDYREQCLSNQLFVFALGTLLYFIISDNYKINVSPKSVLCLLALILLQFIFSDLFRPSLLVFSGCFFVAVLILSKYQPALLVNRFLKNIGVVSYSLYLVHYGVLTATRNIVFLNVHNSLTALADYSIRFALTLMVSWFISLVTYKLIEQPFINLGERITKPRQVFAINSSNVPS